MDINNFEDLMNFINGCDNIYRLFGEIHRNGEKYINMCNSENIIDFITVITEKIPSAHLFPWFHTLVCKKFGFNLFFPMTRKMDFNDRHYAYNTLCNHFGNDKSKLINFIDGLIDNNEFAYICDNMEKIIVSQIFSYSINDGLLTKLKEIAPEKFDELHSLIITKIAYPKDKNIDDRTINALTLIAEEISENEKTDISELEKIGNGEFSTAYKLGNKVIKFGKKRETYNIPYHRRLLQPLIRKMISSDYSPIYIEISEYLEPDESITDEDVYSIYKELRDDGIVWTDPQKANLGRLKKENIIHYNDPLYVEDSSLGFNTPRPKETPLQKGEIVIIDTDFLYPANNFDINDHNFEYNVKFYKYEERYQRELAQTKKNNSKTETSR